MVWYLIMDFKRSDLTYWYDFTLDDYFQEKKTESIAVSIERPRVPVIFLDTFCMFEMIKAQNGTSTDSHCKQYGRLRELITELIAKGKILSPLCIQETEIGSTEKHSEIVKYLMDYTNIDFYDPADVQRNTEKYAFLSFLKNANWFVVPFSVVHNIESMEGSTPNHRVHRSIIKSKAERDKENAKKKETAELLKELRDRRLDADYKTQLDAELSGDLQTFDELRRRSIISEVYFYNFCCKCEEIKDFLQSIQYSVEHEEGLQIYRRYLQSNHHIAIPYVWIRSVLWAKHLIRRNRIQDSDPNDNAWASAYLPFMDYCFTDNAFADLIQRTRLEKQFGTKVFSPNRFDVFLKEIEKLL